MAPVSLSDKPVHLDEFLDGVGALLRDKRQRASFALYTMGLLNDGERKSMEPIAARLSGDPASCPAVHQRLLHFVSSAAWRDQAIRDYTTRYAIDAMQTQAPIQSWVVDDTGFLKQGKHSPAVQRQYSGTAGKTANCQIGVSLVFANNNLACDR